MISARAFHDATTHTPQSIRTSGHALDWDNKPFPFKVYTELPALPLPRAFDPIATDALAALDPARRAPTQRLDLDRLAALLYFTAGVTKKKTYYGGGATPCPAPASAGGPVPTRVYV